MGTNEKFLNPKHEVAAAQALMQDVITVFTWKWVVDAVEELESLHEGRPDDDWTPLSPDYAARLGSIEVLLHRLFIHRKQHIQLMLSTRGGFNGIGVSHEARVASNLGHYADPDSLRSKKKHICVMASELFEQDPLDFCIATMIHVTSYQYNQDGMSSFDHPMLFAILDDFLPDSKKPGNREMVKRLDDFLLSNLTDLSSMTKLLQMIQLHRPKAPKLDMEEVLETAVGVPWRYLKKSFLEQSPWRPFRWYRYSNPPAWGNTLELYCEEGPVRQAASAILGTALGKFRAVVKLQKNRRGRSYDRPWLQNQNDQREAMDALWQAMSDRYAQLCERLGLDDQDIGNDLKFLCARDDPEYIANTLQEIEDIEAIIEEDEKSAAQKKPSSTTTSARGFSSDSSSAATSSAVVAMQQLKLKSKTTGVADPTRELVVRDPTPEPVEEIRLRIQPAYQRVFGSMCPGRDVGDRVSVKWDDFVKALAASPVYLMTEPTDGSEFKFEGNELSPYFGLGSIVFHRPHKENFYTALQMRAIGKRLQHWFGCDRQTFCLDG